MALYPKALQELIAALSRLPGIGRKTAERLSLHLVRAPESEARRLSQALARLRDQVRTCQVCRNLADSDPCPICSDPARDSATLCVVETPADLSALEAAGTYQGRYFVLAGALDPLEGVGPGELNLQDLVGRVKDGGVTEVIIATNPTVEGEATADLVRRSLQPSGVTITRLGYGMPVGGDLKYMDGVTLGRSLEARKKMEE